MRVVAVTRESVMAPLVLGPSDQENGIDVIKVRGTFVCFACIECKEMMDCPGGYSQFSSCSRIWRGKVR